MSTSATKYHKVTWGDTLWSVAQRYADPDASTLAIKKLADLIFEANSDNLTKGVNILTKGSYLKIPPSDRSV